MTSSVVSSIIKDWLIPVRERLGRSCVGLYHTDYLGDATIISFEVRNAKVLLYFKYVTEGYPYFLLKKNY